MLTTPVPSDVPTFAGVDRCVDLASLDADFAIIGVPYGTPSSMVTSRAPSSEAPDAIRLESRRYAKYLTHPDVDFGGPILGDPAAHIVDCGDVAMAPGDWAANRDATTEAIRTIRRQGAVPIIIGGDHAIPVATIPAFDDVPRLDLVQFDAHYDYRDEINGERFSLSSGTRRASEQQNVDRVVQIGLRGIGSARQSDLDDIAARGNTIITAAQIDCDGPDAMLQSLHVTNPAYVTLDMDALDPAVAPGVNSPAFGGLTYWHVTRCLAELAQSTAILGLDLCEVAPRHDVRGLTSLLAARLTLNAIGSIVRSPHWHPRV